MKSRTIGCVTQSSRFVTRRFGVSEWSKQCFHCAFLLTECVFEILSLALSENFIYYFVEKKRNRVYRAA
jgi:hypothetical protein